MSLKTYQDRVAEIRTVEDIDKHMELTQKQINQANARANRSSFLHQKLKHIKKADHHTSVLRQLRINRFNLEDKLKST